MTVEMFVYKVGIDATGKTLVVLADQAQGRLLPILIGLAEARSIAAKLEGVVPLRPYTHDLMANTLEALGYALRRVTVTRLSDGIFYAELLLAGKDGKVSVDSRPSDALALAVRTGARIWVDESVLLQAQVLNEQSEQADQAEQAEQDRLRELLEGIPIPEEPEMDSGMEDDDTED